MTLSPPLLDFILAHYVTLLNGALATIIPYGIGLLVGLAVIEFRWTVLWSYADGFFNYAAFFGAIFGLLIRFGLLFYFITNAGSWSNQVYEGFLQLGAAAAPSVFLGDTPLSSVMNFPSAIMTLGFQLVRPLMDFQQSFRTVLTLGHWTIPVIFLGTYVLVVLMFAGIALNVFGSVVEFKGAVVWAVLGLGWGALNFTAFLFGGAVRWLAATLVRLFLLVVFTGVGVAIFLQLTPMVRDAGLDPTITQAIMLFVATVFIFSTTMTIPAIGAGAVMSMGSGGGMSAGALLLGGQVGVTAARAAAGVIRGTSNLVR